MKQQEAEEWAVSYISENTGYLEDIVRLLQVQEMWAKDQPVLETNPPHIFSIISTFSPLK